MWDGVGGGERLGMGVEVVVWGYCSGGGPQVEKLFFGFIKIYFFCMYVSVCVSHVCS